MYRCEDCGYEFEVKNPEPECMYRCPECRSLDTNENIVFLGDEEE